MNKLFSNKVFLQIISVVLLIISINLFMLNRNSNKYVYESVDRNLKKAITELENMNEVIFNIYMQENSEKEYKIHTNYIGALAREDREIRDIYNIKYGAFDWFELEIINWNIRDIKDKKNLTKEDEQYLKTVHKYNKELIKAYYKVLDDNDMRLNKDYGKLKKEYKEFITQANKISMKKEYSKLRKYKVRESEGTENIEAKKEKNRVSLQEAKELTTEVLQKIFKEKPVIIEDKKSRENTYEFYNEWEDGKDKNSYNISVGKEDGSFSMYRSSQLVTAVVSEENLEQKAIEIKDIFVPKDYVCYEKKKRFDEGNLDEINYKFIRKVDDVYDESHQIQIEMNCYGSLSDLRISDPLNYKVVNIEKPKVAKKDIVSKLTKGNVINVILVKNTDEELEYRVFIELNEEIYTYIFNANTGDKIDTIKSERMYFKRVNNI
ncbi:hypothetical protein [Tepidibacter hydrothermalis]|uniref:Germination protein YpeB n=1 Tax=Tepidibacter hydrothermalis TaxID=3036126 RepID=A0ABY8EI60_9FIRM|nr:hypothetical protein [Tepidibacter hydrothermalis]WFD11504.1 hypothetical protein P4S50_05360 [Tepidibacter hydrothermalis]